MSDSYSTTWIHCIVFQQCNIIPFQTFFFCDFLFLNSKMLFSHFLSLFCTNQKFFLKFPILYSLESIDCAISYWQPNCNIKMKRSSFILKRRFLRRRKEGSFHPSSSDECVCLWGIRNPSGHHMAVSRIGYGTQQVKVHLSYISNHGSSAGRPSTTLLRV